MTPPPPPQPRSSSTTAQGKKDSGGAKKSKDRTPGAKAAVYAERARRLLDAKGDDDIARAERYLEAAKVYSLIELGDVIRQRKG